MMGDICNGLHTGFDRCDPVFFGKPTLQHLQEGRIVIDKQDLLAELFLLCDLRDLLKLFRDFFGIKRTQEFPNDTSSRDILLDLIHFSGIADKTYREFLILTDIPEIN